MNAHRYRKILGWRSSLTDQDERPQRLRPFFAAVHRGINRLHWFLEDVLELSIMISRQSRCRFICGILSGVLLWYFVYLIIL